MLVRAKRARYHLMQFDGKVEKKSVEKGKGRLREERLPRVQRKSLRESLC